MPRRPLFSEVHREPLFMTWLRRTVVCFVGIHVVLSMWSGYRAIVQVYEVELRTDRVLRSGSSVWSKVIGSGRVPVRAKVELIQGARRETLATFWVPENDNPSYDPWSQQATTEVILAPYRFRGFTFGPAVVRTTAFGSSQFLRTPPPEVRELTVEIRCWRAWCRCGARWPSTP